MPDDNSLDVLGIKPLAKAVEKAAERSVDGVSSFFGAICMPAAEEFGLLLLDKRFNNSVDVGRPSCGRLRDESCCGRLGGLHRYPQASNAVSGAIHQQNLRRS